jgi:geranylgeranyl pyrophosphate synthase
MTNYKTAYYTVVAPMQLGALLAGRSDNLLSNISSFGSPLGIAFQLQDDVLGLFGTQEDIGKPQSSDLQEGKQTLLIKYGLEKTKNKEKAFVKSCLRNKKLSEADLHRLRTILADCGAKDEVRKVALEHQDVAIKAIPSLTMDKRYQAILHGLCHYMVDRDH